MNYEASGEDFSFESETMLASDAKKDSKVVKTDDKKATKKETEKKKVEAMI